MSTILDALRKVEEERRASGYSTRERLLFFPQVIPPPSRKGVWVIGLVFMSVGFAVGAGMALFRSGPMASVPVTHPTPLVLAPTEQPSARPVSSIATASCPPEEQGSNGAQEHNTQEGLQDLSVGDLPFPAVVQRSPFAAPKEQYKSERQLHGQATLEPQTSGSSSSPLAQTRSLRSLTNVPPSPSLDLPKVSLNLLQWSPEVERRLAFISINGGPLFMVHEGDTVSDLTVERILPDTVELRFGDSTFVVKPRPSSSSPAPLAP